MSNLLSRALLLVLLFLFPASVSAVLINFETLTDLEPVTNQFADATFSNTTVLTAGVSLNEFEFPPKSGANVVFDDGGAIVITFSTPQASVSGHLTYLTTVTFTAFDASLNAVGSDTSNFSANLGLSGDVGSTPNELFGVASLLGISRLQFREISPVGRLHSTILPIPPPM